ncbi:MAG TPA: GNAT family N-acetyltransferase [Gemmatimonadaceae bacterium]|nr:GNAT family N-acetyltransferase [Gemmatimonadaceae bacterium]
MARPTLTVHGSIAEVPAEAWDRLFAHEADRASPFVRHAFLAAAEASGSATPRTGWRPRHLVVRRGGEVVAAAPAYARTSSDGDFGRDWEWAAAAARAGLPYFPKLVLGVPFTPATGRRLLVAPGEGRAALVPALLDGVRRLCAEEELRSVHALFVSAEEARELEALGMALRVDFQYHWRNEGYASPDEFLARFPSKRRNTIRRERAAPAAQGIAIRTVRGDELARDPGGWAEACFALHRATTDRMAWGMRFVNRAFYERVLAGMPDAVEVVEARRAGKLVGMAFNLASPAVLYGRYWGCIEDHPFLHFNVALYHSIDECIRRGLQRFEGGAGGEHKVSRGFEPAETWSAHLFLDRRLDAALRRHLSLEREDRLDAVARWRDEHPRLGG